MHTLEPEKMAERKRHIYEIRRSHPTWTYQDIGDLVGLSRQRVQQIVHEFESGAIIAGDMENLNQRPRLDGQPIAPSQLSRETGIPIATIVKWVSKGHVKVVYDPGQTGPGRMTLLDPVTLQQRLDRYHPRRPQAIPA